MKAKCTIIKLISILACFLVCISAWSCTSKNNQQAEDDRKLHKYDSIISSIANSDEDVAKIESSFWSSYWTGVYFKSDDNPDTNSPNKEMTVSFNGKEYTGKYHWSIYEFYNSYITDEYVCDNGASFSVKRGSNNIVELNLKSADKHFYTEPYLDDLPDSQEYAISLAKSIAKEIVSDPDDYKLEISSYKGLNEFVKDDKTYSVIYYDVTFLKEYGGYLSSDYFTIEITSKGNFVALIVGDTNIFDNKIIDVDKDLVSASITDKINSAFDDAVRTLLNTNITSQTIAVTPDGLLCLITRNEVEYEYNKDKSQIKTGIEITTILE